MIPTNSSEARRATTVMCRYLDFLLSGRDDPRRTLDYCKGGKIREEIEGAFECLFDYAKFLNGDHREFHERTAADLYVRVLHAMPECHPGVH